MSNPNAVNPPDVKVAIEVLSDEVLREVLRDALHGPSYGVWTQPTHGVVRSAASDECVAKFLMVVEAARHDGTAEALMYDEYLKIGSAPFHHKDHATARGVRGRLLRSASHGGSQPWRGCGDELARDEANFRPARKVQTPP